MDMHSTHGLQTKQNELFTCKQARILKLKTTKFDNDITYLSESRLFVCQW